MSKFEHKIEKLGRQTTHYISDGINNFYVTRAVGQTEEELRAKVTTMVAALNA